MGRRSGKTTRSLLRLVSDMQSMKEVSNIYVLNDFGLIEAERQAGIVCQILSVLGFKVNRERNTLRYDFYWNGDFLFKREIVFMPAVHWRDNMQKYPMTIYTKVWRVG